MRIPIFRLAVVISLTGAVLAACSSPTPAAAPLLTPTSPSPEPALPPSPSPTQAPTESPTPTPLPTEIPTPSPFPLPPKGELIAFAVDWGSRSGGLRVLSQDGRVGWGLPVDFISGSTGYGSGMQIAWSPDGERLAFAAGATRAGHADLFVVNADGSGLRQLTHTEEDELYPTWTPDEGFIVYIYQNKLMAVDLSDGVAFELIEDISAGADIGDPRYVYNPLTMSSGGRYVVFSAGSSVIGGKDLYLFDIENPEAPLKPMIDHPYAEDLYPAFAPRSMLVAYCSAKNRQEKFDILIADLTAGVTRKLTNHEATWPFPIVWSPDGQRLLYSMSIDGQWEIFTIGVDGGDPAQLTGEPGVPTEFSPAQPKGNLWPSWSPDGSQIVFQSNAGSQLATDIYIMNADGSHLTNLTKSPGESEHYPVWQPAGN